MLSPAENSLEALKKAYKEKALIYHPDRQGGNLEYMKLVNMAYDLLKEKVGLWNVADIQGDKEIPLTEKLKEVCEKIKYFEGITIEIMGSWFWITGDTRKYKEELKKLGFRFAPKKLAWYYHEEKYHKFSRKDWNLSEIRDRFENAVLDTMSREKLEVA